MNPRRAPKDGQSRWENLHSQPPVVQRVFNNERVLSQGWYPVCASKALRREQARSFKIFKQRLAIYRSASGQVYALDAFCPHLGADLGNGRVRGETLECYFHQWRFGPDGRLLQIPCRQALDKSVAQLKNRTYPVTEAYGHLWVFSAEVATHDLPRPSGLEQGELTAIWIKEVTLFAHHHVLMANGVDLQHFATVHGLNIDFDYTVSAGANGVFEWRLSGEIPQTTLKERLARKLLGPIYQYQVKFAGGSVVSITYGSEQHLLGFKLPSLQVLWGCLPQENGISKVRIFLVTRRRKGLIGKFKNGLIYGLSLALLTLLKDEDIKAFPNMRFNTHRLIKEDASLARLIQLTNQLDLSDWGELPP